MGWPNLVLSSVALSRTSLLQLFKDFVVSISRGLNLMSCLFSGVSVLYVGESTL